MMSKMEQSYLQVWEILEIILLIIEVFHPCLNQDFEILAIFEELFHKMIGFVSRLNAIHMEKNLDIGGK